MKVRVFTLAFDAAAGGFVDGALNTFMAHHEALEVRHEFFVHERSPWLVVLVGYRDAAEGRGPALWPNLVLPPPYVWPATCRCLPFRGGFTPFVVITPGHGVMGAVLEPIA